MSKIELNDTNSGYNLSTINLNFQRIKAFLNDRVLTRTREVGETNEMSTDLDMNNKRVFNLPRPILPSEALRLQDLVDINSGGTGTVTVVGVNTVNGFKGTVSNPSTNAAIAIGTTVSGILKGNGDSVAAAVANTDFQSPIGTIAGIAKGNGANALTVAVAETDYVTPSGTGTLSNKRISVRVGSTTSSATPTINTDNVDVYKLTAQAVDITSFTTNLTGTPTDSQCLIIEITGTAARAITWGASFEASTVALPTTTVTTAMLAVAFLYNAVTSKWRCVGAV